jgi:chromosome segregation ATPase
MAATQKKQSSVEDQPMTRVLRQRELVENMKHDNEILRLDLTRESRDARKSSSSGAAADIGRLQDEASRYMKKIETERAKIAELDKQIVQYQEQILDQKTRLGGVNAAQVNNKLIQKQIKVLDNRLDKCLLKYNETVAHNKVLRQKIDEYRRERIVFDVIYKKIERDLHEKKKEMTAIINDSKNAYQARDKSQSEMRNLQSQAEKERSDFEIEFKDLGDMIKQQQIMLEQLRLKQFERTNDENVVTTSVSEERSGELANSMSNWGVGIKDKNLAPLSQEKIHSYEEMLLKIQESTGIYDINEIVNKFMEAEEQNFSLFNYVNDVNSEIERLEHSISSMRNQIEKYKGQDASSNTQRKKTVRDLEDKLTKTDKKAEEYEGRYNLAVRTINQLKNGIQSIFTRIGATSASVDEMLGNQGVTESNMMQYLGIIEQRTTEILQAYAASQIGLPNEHTLQLPSVVPADGTGKVLPATIPSYEDMSSGEDSEGEKDERPLTRQELEKRALREFTRKSGMMSTND